MTTDQKVTQLGENMCYVLW